MSAQAFRPMETLATAPTFASMATWLGQRRKKNDMRSISSIHLSACKVTIFLWISCILSYEDICILHANSKTFVIERWLCFNNKSNSNETNNLVCGSMNGACLIWFTLLAFIFCNNNYPSMKASYVKESVVFLLCNFTIKQSSKIFEIEKINRQTMYKNGLILPKKRSFQAKTMTLRSWKHAIEVLWTYNNSLKACK